MKLTTYLLTLKSLKNQDPSAMLYMDFIAKLYEFIKDINIGDNAFEYDSKGKLHLHVLVFCNHSINYKQFVKFCFTHDMYAHFIKVDMKELDTVTKYIHKRHTTSYVLALEQKEIAKYYENNYGFV